MLFLPRFGQKSHKFQLSNCFYRHDKQCRIHNLHPQPSNHTDYHIQMGRADHNHIQGQLSSSHINYHNQMDRADHIHNLHLQLSSHTDCHNRREQDSQRHSPNLLLKHQISCTTINTLEKKMKSVLFELF